MITPTRDCHACPCPPPPPLCPPPDHVHAPPARRPPAPLPCFPPSRGCQQPGRARPSRPGRLRTLADPRPTLSAPSPPVGGWPPTADGRSVPRPGGALTDNAPQRPLPRPPTSVATVSSLPPASVPLVLCPPAPPPLSPTDTISSLRPRSPLPCTPRPPPPPPPLAPSRRLLLGWRGRCTLVHAHSHGAPPPQRLVRP